MVCVARAHTDIADIAGLDDIVQSVHGLLDGGVIIKSVAYTKTHQLIWYCNNNDMSRTLENIDIVELKTLQAVLHGVEDVLAVQTPLVDNADILRSETGFYEINIGRGGNWKEKKKRDRSKPRCVHVHEVKVQIVLPGAKTLVRITSSSRGRLSFLIAFPSTTSERPFE